MRILTMTAMLAVLLPSAAEAADKCGPLQMIDSIQMLPQPVSDTDPTPDTDIVPVKINGVEKKFNFSTAGFFTEIWRSTVDELQLPARQGPIRVTNLRTKEFTSEQAQIKELIIGHMRGHDQSVPIVNDEAGKAGGVSGSVALYQFESMDADVDFGSDRLNFFSQDHCPGGVLYWRAPAVATIPFVQNGTWITIPVTLDGQPAKAVIASGSSLSALRMDIAEHVYGLTMGDGETPSSGNLLDDTSLKEYRHKFKSLGLGDITIDNPQIEIIPTGAYWDNDRRQLVGDRTMSERNLVTVPELTLGMNVLRQLHLYFAFKEGKVYVSKASASPAADPSAATH